MTALALRVDDEFQKRLVYGPDGRPAGRNGCKVTLRELKLLAVIEFNGEPPLEYDPAFVAFEAPTEPGRFERQQACPMHARTGSSCAEKMDPAVGIAFNQVAG